MNAVLDTITGEILEYCYLIKGPNQILWKKVLANDLERLAQGVSTRMCKRISIIFFIHLNKIPEEKKSMYYKLVALISLLNKEKIE